MGLNPCATAATPEEDRIRVWVDRGYQGTGKDLPGATLMIPHKKSKNHRILTAEQKEHNHLVNSTRVRVEHSIGRLKRYARLADPYDGTISRFNYEFNVITGLVNLHLLWDKIDKGPPSLGRWGTSIDWNGASLLQAAPRSDGRAGAHCGAARVRTQYHESLQNVSSAMRSGAKLIHKSSNNSGALPRIENYVGLRIESTAF